MGNSRDFPAKARDMTTHVKSKEEGGFVPLSQRMLQTLSKLFNLCEPHVNTLCDMRVIIPTTGCFHSSCIGVLY